MAKVRSAIFFSLGLLLLSACVNIVVNFPAGAADEQIEKLFEQIYGTDVPVDSDGKTSDKVPAGSQSIEQLNKQESILGHLLDFVIPAAHADVNFSINSESIDKIKTKQQEYAEKLRPYFQSGAIGFANGGLVGIRDINKIPPPHRASVQQMVSVDNQGKDLLYKEIAKENGNISWEGQIRSIAETKLMEKAQASGWWYQNASGAWAH